MKEKEVLVSITTYHGKKQRDGWRAMLCEVEQLGLPKAALFLTGLEPEQRKECYLRLEEIRDAQGLEIPFVHARSDMTPDEYYWLIEKMGTEVFNLHAPTEQFPHTSLDAALRQRVCLENSGPLRRSNLEGFGGLCLDLSHLEDARRCNSLAYHNTKALMRELPVLANHVSAIPDKPRVRTENGEMHYDDHYLEALEEVDYVSRYSSRYIGRFVALELYNPISQQLEVAVRLSAIVREIEEPPAKAA